MMKFKHIISATTVLMAVSGTADAHPGHMAGNGFMSGLLHPLLGVDHLLVMLAVGFWSFQLLVQSQGSTGLTALRIPVLFLLTMLTGAWLGADYGLFAGMVEQLIFASAIVMALLVSGVQVVPTRMVMPLVGLFALFHGIAHGSEATGNLAVFMSGFMLTTAGLLFAGHRLGAYCQSRGFMLLSGRLLGIGLVTGAGSLLLLA